MYYNDDTILFLDGKFVKAAEASTDLYSQSLHYGYSAFEGIRSYKTSGGTKIFKAEEHFLRLQKSCEAVYIPYPWDNDELIDVSYQLLQQNNLQDAYIRPMVYCPPQMTLQKATGSNIMIAVWNWGAYLGDKLVRVGLSTFRRPNPDAFIMHAKVGGHYINSIMASQQAKDKGFDEALMLDVEGFVAEGPGANVFYEKDGRLFTPSLGHILPGITRATILELCDELDIPVEEKRITIEELLAADAVFYCGTAAEVIGWYSLDDHLFPKPWNESIGRRLQLAYKQLVTGRPVASVVSR